MDARAFPPHPRRFSPKYGHMRDPSELQPPKMALRSYLASDPNLSSERQIPSLLDLPVELQLLISEYLTYPDALSLKHTHRHFYNLVYTGIHLKIEWLIERRGLHLDCPNDRKCELGSDVRFCRGSVELLMKRRREHDECETRPGGRGCIVLETAVCEVRKEKMARQISRRMLEGLLRQTAIHWWALIGLLGVLFALTGTWAALHVRRVECGNIEA